MDNLTSHKRLVVLVTKIKSIVIDNVVVLNVRNSE